MDGAVCCVVLCCVVLALSPVSRTPGGCGQWTVLYVVLCCVVLCCISSLTGESDAGRLRAVDGALSAGSEAGRVDGHAVLVAVDWPPVALTHHLGTKLGWKKTGLGQKSASLKKDSSARPGGA